MSTVINLFQILIVVSAVLGFTLPIIGITCRNKIDWEQYALTGLVMLISSMVLWVITIIINA